MMNNSNRNQGQPNRFNPTMKRPNSPQNGTNAAQPNNSAGRSRPPIQKKASAPNPKQPQNRPDNLENLANLASKHLNTSPEQLKQAAQNGNVQDLLSQMTPSQAQQVQKILSDENAAKKLLSTPQAQELIRRLSKNE